MTASTTIEAGVSVFGTDVYDIFGSVEQFRMKVNTHVHSGVKGGPNLTQPPTRTME
jgi:hypothetical protein